MKKTILTIFTAAALVSCAKNPAENGGTLRLDVENAAFVAAVTRAGGQLDLAELGETLPDPMGLSTRVSSLDPDILLDGEHPWRDYPSVSAANEEKFLYRPGRYRVHIGRPAETEGLHLPCFEGSADVTVTKGESTTARLRLQVSNTAVRIRFTDAFKSYFANGATVQLKTAAGGLFTVSYAQEEDALFWILPQEFTLSGTAVPQDPSPGIIAASPVAFKDLVLADVQPQTLYTCVFDMDNAGGTDGEGVRILLNDTPVETIEENVELNPDASK